ARTLIAGARTLIAGARTLIAGARTLIAGARTLRGCRRPGVRRGGSDLRRLGPRLRRLRGRSRPGVCRTRLLVRLMCHESRYRCQSPTTALRYSRHRHGPAGWNLALDPGYCFGALDSPTWKTLLDDVLGEGDCPTSVDSLVRRCEAQRRRQQRPVVPFPPCRWPVLPVAPPWNPGARSGPAGRGRSKCVLTVTLTCRGRWPAYLRAPCLRR
ncbi:MAG: hypothetical protein JWO67_1813, partial [Streptosporangiaceae bacterium]|nr:hypothetical protein [Streptosporangiaceae bacterium]